MRKYIKFNETEVMEWLKTKQTENLREKNRKYDRYLIDTKMMMKDKYVLFIL